MPEPTFLLRSLDALWAARFLGLTLRPADAVVVVPLADAVGVVVSVLQAREAAAGEGLVLPAIDARPGGVTLAVGTSSEWSTTAALEAAACTSARTSSATEMAARLDRPNAGSA